MNKKWIKLLTEMDGKAVGTAVEEDEPVANALVKTKAAEFCPAPEVAVDKTLNDPGLAELVRKSIRDAIRAEFAEAIDAKGVGSKRPRVQVGDANELDDPTDGFKGLNDFARTVHKACTGGGIDKRLEMRLKASGASEGVNADGGYATPVEYATTVFNDVTAQDSLLNSCFTIPMTSNSIKLPALNYTTQGSFGVTAYWEGEGQSITPSKANYRQPQLTLNKLAVLTPVTSELLEDGIAVEQTINYLAGQAITYKVNEAIVNGTGVGQPTGIVGHGSTVAVARNTALAVKAIDVTSMDSAFVGDENRAEWLVSKADVNPQLLTIADGAGRYLYFAPGSFGDAKGPPNLLGKRVRPLINCPTLGTAGDTILWDPKGYVVGYKSTGINKAMSIHLYFATDEVAYRWTLRMDGRPWRDTTLKAAKSASLAYGTAVTLTTKLS